MADSFDRESALPPTSRRRFLHLAVLGSAATLIAACTPAAPAAAPTSAPAKPTAAPASAAPTTAPAPVPTAAPKPTTAAAAKPAAAPREIMFPKPETTRITIAHSTVEANDLQMELARQLNLYQKYGLENVELVYAEGDAKTIQTITSGQAQFVNASAAPALASQRTDSPMVLVGMTAQKMSDDLVSQADVKSPNDLKGKQVAVSTFGGLSHGVVLLSLKGLGLTANDVVITQVGGQSARIAALKAGSVAAAPVDQALRDEMTQGGFNILIRLGDSPLVYSRGGIITTKEFADKNPNTVLAVVAAGLEAQNLLWTQPETAADAYAKWIQSTDRAAAEQQVRFVQTYGQRDLRWEKEGWENMKEVLVVQTPAVADIPVEQAYTFRYLDRLKELGLLDEQGLPLPALAPNSVRIIVR